MNGWKSAFANQAMPSDDREEHDERDEPAGPRRRPPEARPGRRASAGGDRSAPASLRARRRASASQSRRPSVAACAAAGGLSPDARRCGARRLTGLDRALARGAAGLPLAAGGLPFLGRATARDGRRSGAHSGVPARAASKVALEQMGGGARVGVALSPGPLRESRR